MYKNLDITMFMNGVLGGLVGITAGADQMGPTSAIIIGAIGGAVVVLGVALLDKCKLDDPVGAIPMGLRVSDEEEEIGLDISEHGTKAYFSS